MKLDERSPKIDHDFSVFCAVNFLNRNLDFELLGADAADWLWFGRKLSTFIPELGTIRSCKAYVELFPAAVADLLNRFSGGRRQGLYSTLR